MYLCSCRAVTDRTILASIAAGARTPQDLAAMCGAGSRCGGCWPALAELLGEPCTMDEGAAHTAA